MKIAFIDTYYQEFINDVRKANTFLTDRSYRQQLEFLTSQSFGTANFYSRHFCLLGHEAIDIVANEERMQRKWAQESGLLVRSSSLVDKFKLFPFLHFFIGRPTWVQEIVLRQLEKFDADVVYLQDLSILSARTLREIKKRTKLLVGQIACPLPPKKNLLCLDLIISSLPNYVSLFQRMGIKSEYLKLAFERDILRKFPRVDKVYDVTFVGSFTPHHLASIAPLEFLARSIPVHIWGQGINFISPRSPLRNNYHGRVWGKEMFKILNESKIVLNRHISISGSYANNMRLYESTGMGALLLTDYKKNIGDIFEIDKEVITYRNKYELVKKVDYLLAHPDKIESIAMAGQKRTLTEHCYERRMEELESILLKYLA